MHVCHSLQVGGLERIILDLVKASPGRSWRCAVAVMQPGDGLAASIRELGAPVLAVDKREGLDWRALGRLMGMARRFKADVLHAHNSGPAFWAVLAGRALGVPVVVTRHGSSFQQKNLWLRRLTGFLSRRCVCVSRSVLDLATNVDRIPARRLALIYNGVDTLRFSPDPAARDRTRRELGLAGQEKLVISVGRLAPEKAFGDLLSAVAALRAQGRAVQPLLVGEGPERARLSEIASGLGLASGQVLIGARRDVATLLNAADVYCLSSLSEGLSMALLEAMACGLPVVATRVGGNPEAVADGENGLLVPSGDPAGLAEALGRVLDQPELASAMAQASRSLAEARFSQESMLAGYDRIYRELVPR